MASTRGSSALSRGGGKMAKQKSDQNQISDHSLILTSFPSPASLSSLCHFVDVCQWSAGHCVSDKFLPRHPLRGWPPTDAANSGTTAEGTSRSGPEMDDLRSCDEDIMNLGMKSNLIFFSNHPSFCDHLRLICYNSVQTQPRETSFVSKIDQKIDHLKGSKVKKSWPK